MLFRSHLPRRVGAGSVVHHAAAAELGAVPNADQGPVSMRVWHASRDWTDRRVGRERCKRDTQRFAQVKRSLCELSSRAERGICFLRLLSSRRFLAPNVSLHYQLSLRATDLLGQVETGMTKVKMHFGSIGFASLSLGAKRGICCCLRLERWVGKTAGPSRPKGRS